MMTVALAARLRESAVARGIRDRRLARGRRRDARSRSVDPPSMPYIDAMLSDISQGRSEHLTMFERHLHAGFWPEPSLAAGTAADYSRASEYMARRMYEAAGVRDGQRVLDVGCGIGGMVATMNDAFTDMRLTGLNIDQRQLAVARERVTAQERNTVEFVHGNACDLPFDDNELDVLLAVECIFHFPSRTRFLAEAHRVLRPGGRLAISDLVPAAHVVPVYQPVAGIMPFFGYANPWTPSLWGYRVMGRRAGFRMTHHEDVTRNIAPGTAAASRYFDTVSRSAGRQARLLLAVARTRILRYLLMSFEAGR